MGFRFRKSIKIAPGVKLNLNKKSAGITFGGKGFHHTVNSKGKRTTSVGIPGTGLSYSTSSGGSSSKKKNATYNNSVSETDGVENMKTKSKKKRCLPVIIISVIILGIIGSCGTDSDETVTTSALSTVAEELITEEVTTAPETSATTEMISTTVAESTSAITQEITTTEKETTAQKQTTTEKETTTEKKITTTKKVITTKKVTTTKKTSNKGNGVIVPDKTENEGNLVWVPVKGGKKYHSKSSCSGMEDPMKVSVETAEKNGYTPCGRCY